MRATNSPRSVYSALCILGLVAGRPCQAQIDPQPRELLEAGYDAPLEGQGPLNGYAFFYYNDPDLFETNAALRAAISPTYLDSELGFRHLISPYTDFGIGLEGGGYDDDYYEVRQGKLIKSESFNGYGGGMYASIYQLLDPGLRIPLNLIVRGGFHYATFHYQDQTSPQFLLPPDQYDPFTRVGLRLGGKPPRLYPDLDMELSVWYEQQWRLEDGTYGFDNDRRINPDVNRYWVHGGLDYTFKDGQRASLALTAGGSTDADRFSAWRLGGVLPMASEYPLILPGYYYDELTVRRFVHMYAAYDFPLIPSKTLKFRLEGAAADLDYLPGFEQPRHWQAGAGCALTYAPQNKNFQIALRYGYGFNAIRDGKQGAQSIGLLFQYDFEARKRSQD